MKSVSFAITVLLSTLLSFNGVIASPVAADGLDARHAPKTTKCPKETILTTITKGPHKTITKTIKTRPTKCATSTTSVSPSPTDCPICGCEAPAAETVTRTLNWEDIDGLAASRVPIPDHYNDFSVYNPDKNKVYRSGPPPVSVGNGSQVAYADDGRFGLGADGFVFILKSFWILTFLNETVTEATIRVSGPQYVGFTTTVTTDRQFVQILAPSTQSNTAAGFFIEVFAGAGTSGGTLPAWIDDIVYERIYYPATCCQTALLLRATTLNFFDLPASNVPALTPYRGFNFDDGGWTQAALPAPNDYPATGTVLKHVAGPGVFTTSTGSPFALLRLAVYIPPPTTPVVVSSNYLTWVRIDALDASGAPLDFGWEIPAVVFSTEVAKVDIGGDWTGASSDPTGFLDSLFGEFRNVYGIRISVEERVVGGPTIAREFWVDDIVVVPGGGC